MKKLKLTVAMLMLAIPVSMAFATTTPTPTLTTSQEPDIWPLLRDASNTGTTGTLTAYTGSYNLTIEDEIYEDLIFNGQVNIKADNITIKNCRFDTGMNGGNPQPYCLTNSWAANSGPYADLLVKDCEFIGGKSCSIIVGDGTFLRCNMHDSGADAVKVVGGVTGEKVLIKNCFIHHIGNTDYNDTTNQIHSDGVQIRWNLGGDMYFIGTNFDLAGLDGTAPYAAANACAIVQTADGPIEGEVLFKDCYLGGGNYVTYFTDKGNGHGDVEDWNLIDNVYIANAWAVGPLTFDGPLGTISGNRRFDTGVNVDSRLTGSDNSW